MDYKESWALKNWCLWIVVLEKTLESPLDCKEIKPVHPKGNQSWIFIGRTDAEAETPILWPPDAKNWLIGKDRDAEKDWRQEEKGTTEGEMVWWHHQLNGHKFEQPLGVGDGQGGLVCCSPWGHKELDTTERLNWTELKPRAANELVAPDPIFSHCRSGRINCRKRQRQGHHGSRSWNPQIIRIFQIQQSSRCHCACVCVSEWSTSVLFLSAINS